MELSSFNAENIPCIHIACTSLLNVGLELELSKTEQKAICTKSMQIQSATTNTQFGQDSGTFNDKK